MLPDGKRTVGIRPAREGDQSYVARTWVASVLDHGMRPKPGAVAEVNRLIDLLLDEPATKVLVACEPSNDDRIVGFVAYQLHRGARCLLYVCVRHGDRKQGIATLLLGEAGLYANGSPLLYLFDGPASVWAKAKRPDAVKVEPQRYLS